MFRGQRLWTKQFRSLLLTPGLSLAPFPRLQVCASERRRDKEPVLLEGHVGGAAEQHKPSAALDYCFPSAHLGVSARSGGPDAGRGRRAQTPALNTPRPPTTAHFQTSCALLVRLCLAFRVAAEQPFRVAGGLHL